MKKRIDKQTVKQVASVARLNLTDSEVNKLLKELDSILGAFSDLEKVGVKGLEPTFHPLGMKNVLREDKPGKCLTQKEALKNTKHKEDGYFKGPKVM